MPRPGLAVLSICFSCVLMAPGISAQAQTGFSQTGFSQTGDSQSASKELNSLLDGKLFDPGITRQVPAESAPEQLAAMAPWIGMWDVELEIRRPGQDPLRSTGRANFTYMNRGHAIMERTRIADFDGQGHNLASLSFISVNTQGNWSVGEANSWTETISVMSGSFVDQRLVVSDAKRPGGGLILLDLRRTYRMVDNDQALVQDEISTDSGATWKVNSTLRYRRHPPNAEFFPVRDDFGKPASTRPREAAEFDFLVGEFDATHWLSTANGELRWKANSTAVHALDGHAILEFGWHGNDPSVPDAATSIVRVYNRAMRRWESLYLTNRNHQPLHFGGVREDKRIVLHPFAAQTGGNPLSQWIFYDMRPDAYRWKGLRSADRGLSYQLSWAIDFKRKNSTLDPTALTEIHTRIDEGLGEDSKVIGDHRRAIQPASSTVVLFHQAGGDARGEYGDIAKRLHSEGFEVFAWDARGGGDRFGQPNRTVAALAPEAVNGSYCEAYPDLEAALRYASLEGGGGPLYIIGSSYSAALVFRLAAEHGHEVTGAVAFSPASGRMDACAVDLWLPRVENTPLLVFRPTTESLNPAVAEQSANFARHGTEVFVADGVHGASMLVESRSEVDVEPTWERLLAFLNGQHETP